MLDWMYFNFKLLFIFLSCCQIFGHHVRGPGCRVNGQFIRVGAVQQLAGCSQVECIQKGRELLAITKKCPRSQNPPPPGCTRLPDLNTNFPDCCVDRFECPKVIETTTPAVPPTKDNICCGFCKQPNDNQIEQPVEQDIPNVFVRTLGS